jgi:hypothetical protein
MVERQMSILFLVQLLSFVDRWFEAQLKIPSQINNPFRSGWRFQTLITGWWFQTFFIFHNIWDSNLILCWLVVWNICYFPFHMGCHPSHSRTHTFQDGQCTTNQRYISKRSTVRNCQVYIPSQNRWSTSPAHGSLSLR